MTAREKLWSIKWRVPIQTENKVPLGPETRGEENGEEVILPYYSGV